MNATHHNNVELIGRLHGDLIAVTSKNGGAFFDGTLAVQRLSGTVDYLPINIPASLVSGGYGVTSLRGLTLRMAGKMKSYNKLTDGKSRHIILLKVEEVAEVAEDAEGNHVELNGVICSKPAYRETPFGREICDFMLAVNSDGKKSAYIPCISWVNSARKVSTLDMGTTVKLEGRFQSREYMKKLENGEYETRVTHEVSCKYVKVVREVDEA